MLRPSDLKSTSPLNPVYCRSLTKTPVATSPQPPPVVTSATSVFHRDAAYTHTGHSLAAGHGLPALSNAAAFGGVSYAAALEPLPLPITGSGYDGVTLDAPFHSADLHGSDLVPPPPKRGK